MIVSKLWKRTSFLLLILCQSFVLPAQLPQCQINFTNSAPTIDGILDEPLWNGRAADVKDFHQHSPDDSIASLSKTEVWLAFDNKHLFIAAVCHNRNPGKYVVRSLKRDWSYPRNDGFALFLDPFQNGSSAYSFALSPFGAQRDGLVAHDGKFGVTTSWDQVWWGECKQYPDRWTLEMAIPFSSIKFPDSARHWNVNFARHDLKENESTTWTPVPKNQNVAALAFTGIMEFDRVPEKPRGDVSLVPYISAGTSWDFGNPTKKTDLGGAGADLHLGIGTSLNLSLSLFPDFAQAEVDEQQIDLDRFELFFPEKRSFFNESAQLFSNFGFSHNRPFFSRRIGFSNAGEVPLISGLKLGGRINEKWGIGLLNVQTKKDSLLDRFAENFSMVTLERRLLKRSALSLFVNHRTELDHPKIDDEARESNTLVGTEFRLDAPGRNAFWAARFMLSSSFDGSNAQKQGQGWSQGLLIQRNSVHWFGKYEQELTTKAYNPAMGFLRRSDYHRQKLYLERRFYGSGILSIHGPAISFEGLWDLDFRQYQEMQSKLKYGLTFRNSANLDLWGIRNDIDLRRNFDPSGENTHFLDHKTYSSYHLELDYASSLRRPILWRLNARAGEYYLGQRYSADFEIDFRIRPYLQWTLLFERNFIDQVEPIGQNTIDLWGSRLEIAINKEIFISQFLQFNQQREKWIYNARFRYRFAPLSDIFIVFTEGSTGLDPVKENRALVLKLAWWLKN